MAASVVQHGVNAAVGSPYTFPQATGAGNLLVLAQTNNSGATVPASLTVSPGAVSAPEIAGTQSNTFGLGSLYYVANTTAGLTSVSSAIASGHIFVVELSGIVTASPVDASGATTHATATSQSQVTGTTPAQADEVVVLLAVPKATSMTSFTAGTATPAGGSSTNMAVLDSITGTTSSCALEWAEITNANVGAVTGTITFNPTSVAVLVIATFKVAAVALTGDIQFLSQGVKRAAFY